MIVAGDAYVSPLHELFTNRCALLEFVRESCNASRVGGEQDEARSLKTPVPEDGAVPIDGAVSVGTNAEVESAQRGSEAFQEVWGPSLFRLDKRRS
jgi:hypothetical protein